MTISEYLLQNHLKPLFIFKFDLEDNLKCFGVFVGCKGAKTIANGGDRDFPVGLTWDGASTKPSWFNKTPVWIIPLKNDNGKYDLDYDSSPDISGDIKNCFISIVNQAGTTDWSNWKNYNDFRVNTVINFSHHLNFKAKKIVLDVDNMKNHIINDGTNSITVWISETDKISTQTRLIKFKGIECDLVNEIGNKLDFDIWCGIRDKKDDKNNQNKIHLSINSETSNDSEQSEGIDCPIVWREIGILDETVFPAISADGSELRLSNPKFELHSTASLGDLSNNIATIVYNTLNANTHYSWFIKEKDNSLSPFFRYINKGKEKKELVKYFAFNTHDELDFFQINRFVDGNFDKAIISWVVGNLIEKTFESVFEKHTSAKSYVNRSAQQTITPLLDNFKFAGTGNILHQVMLEHQISNDKVSFVGLKLFDPNTKKYAILELDNQTIKLPYLRLSTFQRRTLVADSNGANPKPLDLSEYFKFNNFKFTSKEINRQTDNGTAFGFNIQSTGIDTTPVKQKGVFNDGSFSFELDKDGIVQGKVYLSFQLQKAQKPLYLWEWYEGLDKKDILVPCYSIEDFELPVSNVTPLSTDQSGQDRYIPDDDDSSLASTGTLRPIPPLIIPISDSGDTQKYSLSFSENINVGQDFNISVELIRTESIIQTNSQQATFKVVVLGNQPQTAVKIETPFGSNPQYDNNKWVVARKSNLSADGAVWEILNDTSNEKGITITFPPQAIGESFRKTVEEESEILDGEPINNKLVEFKFSPPAQLQVANEQLNRQMVTTPWNIRNLFAAYGDSNPGLRLLKAQFELLYGMSANFENKDAFIAELENKLGQAVRAPRGRIAWKSNKKQDDAFKKAYASFIQMLKLINSRLAIFEVSSVDKFRPVKFTEGINYFFRVDYDEKKDEGKRTTGAKLKWPFQGDVPEYLKDIKMRYHQPKGLAGGFHFGFESQAIYKEVWDTGFKYGSSSGEIENLAYSSAGGYGKQVARFCNDKTIIKSTTGLGRTHFYAIERIGRIGVFWNRAKHVIEYERTVVPSKQFKGTKNEGRVIVRKVREFVEILEPQRKYPEFGADSSSAGSILGSHFKSIKIPVSSSWGNDIMRDQKPIGWEVPLWNPTTDKTVYPFPQIMLSVMASKESQLNNVLCNLANPENLYFYTDVRDEVYNRKITSQTDQWPSVPFVDYTPQPFENIYLGCAPCLDHNDSKLVNTPLASPLDVLPGFERYTFRITPSDLPIAANGAYNKDSNIVGKLRTVTMQRKPTLKTGNNGEPILYIKDEQQKHLDKFHGFLKENLNGYTSLLKNPSAYRDIDDLKELVVEHISSIAKIDNKFDPKHLEELTKTINKSPNLRYLTTILPTETPIAKSVWEIPTITLWFQLLKQLDSGIGAVDKNYTLLFGEMQKELNQLIRETNINQLKTDILKPIESFKKNITDLKSQVDINLNQFDKLVNSETTAVTSYLENGYETINKSTEALIVKGKNAIDSIIEPTITLDNFKTEIKSRIKDEINGFLKTLSDGINVNKKIKDRVIIELISLIDKEITNKMATYLEGLDDVTFKLQEAKEKLNKQLTSALTEIKSGVAALKTEVNKIKDEIVKEVNTISESISGCIEKFKQKLEEKYKEVTQTIEDFEGIIKSVDVDKIQTEVDLFFAGQEIGGHKKFDKVEEIIKKLISALQEFLDKDYKANATSPVPPLAHLFNQADQWLKEQLKDFRSFLNKLADCADVTAFEKTINENYEKLKSIYVEFKELEEAIKKGNTDVIIKEANKLSQAINKDFGQAIGDVTKGYYAAVDLINTHKDLDTEFQTVLFNYRSVFEEIKAVDLGFNRKTIELIYNFDKNIAPRLVLTPVMGKLQKLNDSLNSMGISIPYAALEDMFVAPMKEWGAKFGQSLSEKFPMSNLLNDIGGINFDNLFPFLKADDAFMKAVKITHDLDKEALKAWVKADVDYTFTSDNIFMNIGPVSVIMLSNARISAQAYESMDIDRNRTSENFGALKATFAISLSGTPLMLFKETVVSFKNGKYDFDLDPSRMEMPGLLKALTDASQNIQATAPVDDEEASPFKLEILKVHRDIPGSSLEMPIGVKASLDLPPLSVGGGPTSMSNLSFGGNFIMKAIDENELPNIKLDFLVGLGFYFGKRDLPFNFTAFILGGGGYIDCNFLYRPSKNSGIDVDFIMSIHASAAFALSAGWISGSIMILAGIEVEYKSEAVGGTRIEIFIAIIGVVDILGLISIYLSLRLAINYLSNGSGTVLYGTGTVKVKIKICAFVTIKVSKSYTMILQGESKSVSNSRSEEISTSLN